MRFEPFTDLNDVPTEIAVHQGARRTLEQVNTLIARAYVLGSETLPDMGAAQAEFRMTHHINNDIWVGGAADGSNA